MRRCAFSPPTHPIGAKQPDDQPPPSSGLNDPPQHETPAPMDHTCPRDADTYHVGPTYHSRSGCRCTCVEAWATQGLGSPLLAGLHMPQVSHLGGRGSSDRGAEWTKQPPGCINTTFCPPWFPCPFPPLLERQGTAPKTLYEFNPVSQAVCKSGSNHPWGGLFGGKNALKMVGNTVHPMPIWGAKRAQNGSGNTAADAAYELASERPA